MWRHLALYLIALTETAALATDRHFPDISASSTNGEFRVEAISPDNKADQYKAFQARFVYTCTETRSGKTLWSRRQAMDDPVRVQLGDGSDFELVLPDEASPVMVRISTTGWTVIWVASDDLIVVRPDGTDVGHVNLREDGLTKEEREKYVQWWTSGPFWTSLSASYFLKNGEDEYFVIRPWWGRRIVVDLKRGELGDIDRMKLSDAAKAREVSLVLSSLKDGAESKDAELSRDGAAYLAGVLRIREAAPLLRSLEASEDVGSTTFGGLSRGVEYQNEVDPHSYSEFTTRQIAQLSLRRVGESPAKLPCYRFKLQFGDDSKPFTPTPISPPRHENVPKVQEGMRAKEVLLLLGSPDFVDGEAWSYDMDTIEPFSVTLTFDAKSVTKIKRDVPLWKSVGPRDEALTR